jgi:hypothetical protein
MRVEEPSLMSAEEWREFARAVEIAAKGGDSSFEFVGPSNMLEEPAPF